MVYIVAMKKRLTAKSPKGRCLIPWNTGQRVERPRKGKGSYRRNHKHKNERKK